MAELSNYVKFRRGTPEAFRNLVKKDSDTLYFIYSEDSNVSELYLGNKLIAAANETVAGATTLRNLTDTLITEGLNAESFLVFDITTGKWIDKPISSVLSVYSGATDDAAGISGLVPSASPAQKNYFLRGDGQWAEVVVASEARVLQTIVGTDEDHPAAITRILNGAIPAKGDIIVLLELIANDKYQHTSYAFDGASWIAMDGNYNAESIYFDSDLTFTYAFGRFAPDASGSVTIEAKGKNLKDLLEEAYSLEEKTGLATSQPTASINGSIKYYEIGSTGTQDITVSLNSDGAYKYGYSSVPASGNAGDKAETIVNNGTTLVSADSSLDAPYELTFNGENISPKAAKGATFTLAPVAQLEKTEMKAQGTVHYVQGAIPVSNLGKMYPEERIAAGSVSSTSAARARWYIPMYQGFTYSDSVIADPAHITAEQAVALSAPTASTLGAVNKIINADAYDAKKNLTATASKSWRQYFLVVPSDYGWTMSGAKDSNNIDCTVRQAEDITITYGTGDNTVDVVYNVFYINNAADYGTLKISWTM